jgi:hypothetical protein
VRALILLESLVILVLATLILLKRDGPGGPDGGDVFPASRFLTDANPGETATYRVDESKGTLEFKVLVADHGGPSGPPKASIERTFRDTQGTVIPELEPTYTHLLTKHGLFPFMNPEQPAAYEGVWILKRIRRDTISWQGRPLSCWHVECIDPSLPGDRDAIELWMHPDVPVYGILRWQRDGHSFDCISWRPQP